MEVDHQTLNLESLPFSFQVKVLDVKGDPSLKEEFEQAFEYWDKIGRFKPITFPGKKRVLS